MVTLGLDLQQTGNLHRRSQEDRVKHFFHACWGNCRPSGTALTKSEKAKHLVEISLEPMPVPAQIRRSSFSLSFSLSLRNRFRFTLQMVAAAASKRRRISIFSRNLSAHCAGTLRVFGAFRRCWYLLAGDLAALRAG